MRCSLCNSLNPGTALYCAECGAALRAHEATLPETEVTDIHRELSETREMVRRLGRYVSPVVAEGILRDQRRLRGERREVTILFADAVNFTRLSESLDAESVFDLINDLLGRLVECVHRYDGVVDKFTGDGLMAVFGAPIAHENDPELAVRAGLDMQKAAAGFAPIARAQLGAPLQMRVGIHSGLAIAGLIGAHEQVAYTVIGETVNLASRIESLAQPGTVLVSARVYHQTNALFHYQTMGTAQVKGLSQPVGIYEAIGDRSEPLPTRGVAGVTHVFLGRETELEQLRVAVAAFCEDRHGRIVLVQGEAGMGKSRLISEGFSGLADGHIVIWQGRGLPYAQGVGYGVFRSLLNDALHASQADETWDAQVSPALRPFLRQMLGLTLTPEEQSALRYLGPERTKQLTVLALREWILGEARRQPVVLILDDFHWADDLSRDALQTLVHLVYEAPVLLCVMTRPLVEGFLDLPEPPEEESLAAPRCLSLELAPLSAEHSRALLAHLVDLDGLPKPLVSSILTRAEGNPFYIEEFVRMLIEKELLKLEGERWQVASAVALETIEVPTTLRGLMMARVDRLPEDLSGVLRSAAVIGLQFSARLLGEMERQLRGLENVLPSLERFKGLGLLEERPQAGEQVYAFRHIITQETVYRSLLRSQRPELHRIVAESIERLYSDDLSNQVEVLALHYDRARLYDKAMRYAALAGDRARERFANREAIEYYGRALQFSQHLSGYESDRWHIAIGLGEVEQFVGEYEDAIACYRAALDEWGEAAPQDRARVMFKLGQVWEKRGDQQEAEGWLHQGLAQLSYAGAPHPDLHAQIYSELGWLSLRQGDLTAAKERLERGLALVSGTDHYDVLSSILNRLGAVHYHRGEWDRAAECVQQALELRERLGDIVGVARSLNNLGILKKNSGNWDGALADYGRAVELHERIGEIEGLALACTNLGALYTDRGEWSKAEENLHRSFVMVQRIAHPYELAQAHMNLGRLYLLQERWAECARHLNAALPLYAEAGARANLNLNAAYWLQGLLCLEQGRLEDAMSWAERSYDLLCEVTGFDGGESVEWGRYEQLVGRLAQARGDLETALEHLERSTAIFHKTGPQIEAGRTIYWTGVLSLALDWRARASEELTAARQIFEQVGAAADLRRVEEQLARLAAQDQALASHSG